MAHAETLILVVDHLDEWRNRARGGLVREGYGVLLADSKSAALDIIDTYAAREQPIALLVTDRSMGMGRWGEGVELFRALRQMKNKMPVIIYGFDLHADIEAELKRNRGMYVLKDWRPPQEGLRKAVKRMLRRRR